MIHTIPITKARRNLGKIAERVAKNKDYFVLERDGIPVIGILDPDELEDYLELNDPQARRQIKASQKAYWRGEYRDADDFLSELKTELKKKRVS